VRVHEADPKKGGASLVALQGETDQLITAMGSQIMTLHDRTSRSRSPRVCIHPNDLFRHPENIIVWHRVQEFQLVSIRLIAEGLLNATPVFSVLTPNAVRLYSPGSISLLRLVPPPGMHVYVSTRFNAGVDTFLKELKEHIETDPTNKHGQRGRRSSQKLLEGAVTRITLSETIRQQIDNAFITNSDEFREKLAEVTHMILLLNDSTFSGVGNSDLTSEIKLAQQHGIEITLAHENDPARDGCDFNRFFVTTPPELINSGLYSKLAIPCHKEPYRQISLSMVAKAIGCITFEESQKLRSKRAAGQAINLAQKSCSTGIQRLSCSTGIQSCSTSIQSCSTSCSTSICHSSVMPGSRLVVDAIDTDVVKEFDEEIVVTARKASLPSEPAP